MLDWNSKWITLWVERHHELSAHCGAAVITKKCIDDEIFIMKIYIHVIFSNFTKILNHKNLELYSSCQYSSHQNGHSYYELQDSIHLRFILVSLDFSHSLRLSHVHAVAICASFSSYYSLTQIIILKNARLILVSP